MSDAKSYVYGCDLASGSGQDFTGIAIHSFAWPEENEPKPLPRLENIFKEKLTFDQQLALFTQDLFARYPPYYMVFDYTNEKTFTDMMVRDFGKDRVEGIVFGAGLSGTKKMLKDDGKFILREGYKFPNLNAMTNKTKAALVAELIEQLQHEEMILTPSKRESFDHPSGRNNDLAHAWEMSIHGCLKFLLNAGGGFGAYAADYRREHSAEEDEAAKWIPNYDSITDGDKPLFPELGGRKKVRESWNSVNNTVTEWV